MITKSTKIHACWGLAVLLAFGLGTLISSSSNKKNAVGDSANSLPDHGGSGTGDTRYSTRSDGSGASEDSMLMRLFGSYDTNSVSLEMLAEQAFRDPNPITRRMAFGELLAKLTPENALELRELLLDNGADNDEWRDFNYSWGALAGREAFEFALGSEERDMAATMSGWASANPAEAISMLNNLPEEMKNSQAEIAQAVVAGLADTDLALATDLALQLSGKDAGQTDRLMRTVAMEALREGGPEMAAVWAESLPDGPAKGSAMDRIAGSYVRDDPEAAAAWVEQFAEEEYAVRAVAEVGEEWGERDPNAAVGWLETLPSGQGQAEGFRSVMGNWEDSDPVAAGEYLSQMPLSPERDAAVSGFARGYAWQDPETAIAWASDISDPVLREQSLTQAGQAYYRRDPEAAKTWLESSGLPSEAQEQVINPPRRRWR